MNPTDIRYSTFSVTKGERKPLDKKDKVFTWLYKCKVHATNSRSIDDIEKNGTYVTGIKHIDKELEEEEISKYLTIHQMSKLYKDGIYVKVISHKDTKDIYETVKTYLDKWGEKITYKMNISDAPIEELMELDAFAVSVYEHAKYYFTPDLFEGSFARFMTEGDVFNINDFFVKRTRKLVNTDTSTFASKEEQEFAEHESFKNKFADAIRRI